MKISLLASALVGICRIFFYLLLNFNKIVNHVLKMFKISYSKKKIFFFEKIVVQWDLEIIKNSISARAYTVDNVRNRNVIISTSILFLQGRLELKISSIKMNSKNFKLK